MFEVNESLDVKSKDFLGYKIYTVDNFLKDPDSAVNLINDTPAELWKKDQGTFYNGIRYTDRRHFFQVPAIVSKLVEISGATRRDDEGYTNCTFLIDKKYNDYRNNFWFPHYDYNRMVCITYLNKEYVGPGTNIYEQVHPDYHTIPEHAIPWRSRNKYKVVETLEARYNRLVIFNGNFVHGAAYEDDTFFGIERKNLTVFLWS